MWQARARLLEERVHYVHASDHYRLALTEVSRGAPDSDPRPCFVLVHGFSQDRGAFLRGGMPRALVEHGARVFLAELRGHGLSDEGSRRDWSLATHLDLDLPALIDRARTIAQAERVHLIGHSMGGMLGYALLTRGAPLASLATFAAPIYLGRDRPLIRFAALIAGPIVGLVGLSGGTSVPMDYFLRTLAPTLAASDARLFARIFQQVARLANPRVADPATLRTLLERAQPESPRVFVELAELAIRGGPASIAGVDLQDAVDRAQVPVAAVIGTNDIFAPRAAVAGIDGRHAAGRRLIIELPDALHVDLTVGHHAPHIVEQLWNFLVSA
jgi:pimeloyl-ACP methyl ester carboxylesterase